VRVVDGLVSMLHEAPAHWRHFPQFFKVLLEFAQLGVAERELLLHRRVCTSLIDFYLGEESPLAAEGGAHHRAKRQRMGDKFAVPALEHMVELIVLLVRCTHRPDADAARSKPIGPERPPADGEAGGSHAAPPANPTPYAVLPLLQMEDDEAQLARCGPFLAKLLREALSVPAIEALLTHTCHESRGRSNAAVAVVVHGIDTMDSDALAPYLSVFGVLSGLPDSLQEWRVNIMLIKVLRVIANNMRYIERRAGWASRRGLTHNGGHFPHRYKVATASCIRALAKLASQRELRHWLLEHHSSWVKEWLLGGTSDLVRTAAEGLVTALLETELIASAAPPTPPPAPTNPRPSTEAAPPGSPSPALGEVYNHLLDLLPSVAALSRSFGPAVTDGLPPCRLTPYFRTLTWCVRNGAVPGVSVERLLDVYDIQDEHHWECDDTKRAIIQYWHEAACAPQPRAPSMSPLALAARPPSLTRLLDTFVSLRPQVCNHIRNHICNHIWNHICNQICNHICNHICNDTFVSLRPQERFLRFNNVLLPQFYGLIKAACLAPAYRKACLATLAEHRNWSWGVRFALSESARLT
jgi:hypothetical protein